MTPTSPETHIRIAAGYVKAFERLSSKPHYTDDDRRQASIAFLNLRFVTEHLLAALHDLERVQ